MEKPSSKPSVKKKKASKRLVLVCKCNGCKDWKVILNSENARGQEAKLKCVGCGAEHALDYLVLYPSKGLHYESYTS